MSGAIMVTTAPSRILGISLVRTSRWKRSNSGSSGGPLRPFGALIVSPLSTQDCPSKVTADRSGTETIALQEVAANNFVSFLVLKTHGNFRSDSGNFHYIPLSHHDRLCD